MFCRINNTCTSTQLCYLVTPCPKHFKTGCHEKNCTSSPCQNGGVCVDKVNDYRCYRHGFTGKNSEIDINECASNPCQNSGTCIDHANGYSCSCVPGYIGINCEKDFNECGSNPCQNGGRCTDHLNRYRCLCMQGYNGVNCQTDKDECGSNPCQHGGRCIDNVNRYSCLCIPGYIGLRCQTDVNECASNPCHHGGTCTDQVNTYMCNCVSGYGGVNCQTDINECASNPCANGGSCTDHVNRYTCSCVPGYIGSNCQTDFDECQSNPCMNTGSCNNLINSYSCDCTGRYEGDVCQTDCRPGPADIVFIIDTSSSLETNINRSISFITEFIKRTPIGKDDFQVGVITYDFDANVLFDLDDYKSAFGMIAKLQHIKAGNGATFTSPALKKAKEMLTNRSFGSRRISSYIILLYDGLSTDSNDAVNEATLINSIGGRIITVAVGQSISYSEMLSISRKQYYTFSTSFLDDILNNILKETVPDNCTDCSLVTESQVILLLDTNNNQTREDYNKRLTAIRRTVEQIKTYNPDANIGMFSYSDELEQVFTLSGSADIDELISAALKVRIDIGKTISNTSHALKHIRESNLFNSSRNLVVLFSNARWNNLDEIDLEIQLSKQQDIHIFGVAAGDDCDKDILAGVLNDPSLMFYVDEDDLTSLKSLASITKYNNCTDDIFKKRQ
ncbi:matrilin-1-like [Mytilus galloprovincialis]|uniref:matrilin-1-like n=1 Tax=Mytilus galloprovincialis TaxID=29158 RepID=UPI003F7BDD7F